jgi:hypothetical protein
MSKDRADYNRPLPNLTQLRPSPRRDLYTFEYVLKAKCLSVVKHRTNHTFIDQHRAKLKLLKTISQYSVNACLVVPVVERRAAVTCAGSIISQSPLPKTDHRFLSPSSRNKKTNTYIALNRSK